MQNAIDGDGSFDPQLRATIECAIDALERWGARVLSAHRAERFGEEDVTGRSRSIATRDFGWMRSCDAFVGVLPATPKSVPYRSDGTCIELGWASALRRPIVLVTTPGVQYSHLLAGLAAVAPVMALTTAQLRRDPETLVAAVRQLLGLAPIATAG